MAVSLHSFSARYESGVAFFRSWRETQALVGESLAMGQLSHTICGEAAELRLRVTLFSFTPFIFLPSDAVLSGVMVNRDWL